MWIGLRLALAGRVPGCCRAPFPGPRAGAAPRPACLPAPARGSRDHGSGAEHRWLELLWNRAGRLKRHSSGMSLTNREGAGGGKSR